MYLLSYMDNPAGDDDDRDKPDIYQNYIIFKAGMGKCVVHQILLDCNSYRP